MDGVPLNQQTPRVEAIYRAPILLLKKHQFWCRHRQLVKGEPC